MVALLHLRPASTPTQALSAETEPFYSKAKAVSFIQPTGTFVLSSGLFGETVTTKNREG